MDDPILVVEDEADLATTYERLLRRQGYRVVSAGSRGAGILAIETEPLSLVITDLRLPDGDGLDVIRAARARPTPLPVLVASVLSSRASRQAALAAGATAFLSKPFATAVFSRVIAELLATREPAPPGAGP